MDKKPAFGTEEFRDYFRNQYVTVEAGPRFLGIKTGSIYIKVVFAFLISIPLLIASQIEFQPYQIYTGIAYFIFANFVEYILHRYPMHHKQKGAEFLYEHVTIHHAFFDKDMNYIDKDRDLMSVFLPSLYASFIVVIVACVSLPLAFIIGANEALFFAFICMSYYLLYEVFHYSYHCKEDSIFAYVPFRKKLGEYHILHHDSTLMSKYNFNITIPIFDIIFGTLKTHKDDTNE